MAQPRDPGVPDKGDHLVEKQNVRKQVNSSPAIQCLRQTIASRHAVARALQPGSQAIIARELSHGSVLDADGHPLRDPLEVGLSPFRVGIDRPNVARGEVFRQNRAPSTETPFIGGLEELFPVSTSPGALPHSNSVLATLSAKMRS